ncbi:hypothetical protein [Pinisolibacter sp.]|uniref:hypothetical protein n=1 Tax=Pinisolibacter sp. TaxID=2172024 RepID=UPI003FA7ADBC
MPIGDTGAGESHPAIAIARTCIRAGMRGQCFGGVDGRDPCRPPGRKADRLCRLDFVILDEPGHRHRPFVAPPAGGEPWGRVRSAGGERAEVRLAFGIASSCPPRRVLASDRAC